MDINQIAIEYWDYDTTAKKYKINVESIKKSHNLPHNFNFRSFLRENNLQIPVANCRYCQQTFYAYSRHERLSLARHGAVLPCGHKGFCSECKIKPVAINEKCCASCIGTESISKNRDRKSLECHASIEDFSPIEIQGLSYLKANPGCIFEKEKFSLKSLSFALKTSIKETEKVWKGLFEKGGVIIEYSNQGRMSYTGVNDILDIPEYVEINDYNLIKSNVARSIYNFLTEHLHVFVEVPFVAFANFDMIHDELTDEEKKSYFMKRLNFVCCDEDFNVLFLVEYNGQHNFYSENRASESTRFKRKIANLLGIELIEINSPKEMKAKLLNVINRMI